MTEPRKNTISCGFLAPLPLMTLKASQKAKQLELKSPAGRQRCRRHLVVSAVGLIGPYETGHAPLTKGSNNKAEKKQNASEQGLQMLVWPPFWAGPSRLGAVRPRVIRHTCACQISFPRLTSRSTCLGWGCVCWRQGVEGPFGNRKIVDGSIQLKGMFREQDLVCVTLTSYILCNQEAIFIN